MRKAIIIAALVLPLTACEGGFNVGHVTSASDKLRQLCYLKHGVLASFFPSFSGWDAIRTACHVIGAPSGVDPTDASRP